MPVKVWFGNLRWPTGRNLGEFAKDVFRLEKCKTDREKAMAFYKWFIRCFMRGPNYTVPDGFGTYSRTFNPLLMFSSFGSFECTGFGWIAAEALQAAGLKARRVVGQNEGHTIYEVWYKGKDGKAGWHAFDAHQGWWFLNKGREVASCEDLTRNPELVHSPLGHATPLTYNVDMSFLAKRHAWGDALDVVQHVQDETLAYDISPGQSYASLFAPAYPDRVLYCGDEYPRGSHDHITAYDHTGAPLYPENEPFWANYRVNFNDMGWNGSHRPARPHGAGALRWAPLTQGREAAAWADNAVFENGMARPSGANRHCELWYRIKVPYYISFFHAEGFFRGSGSDYLGIGISADQGRTIAPLWTGLSGPFRHMNGLKERKEGKTSVQYLREFLVRLDMHGHNGSSLPVLESLRFICGYQHNLFVQPFLLPGKNTLWLEGSNVDGCRVAARWNYTLNGREGQQELELGKSGRKEKSVNMRFRDVRDITLRGVSLDCVRTR